MYVSSFNDGHMSFGAWGATPNEFRWPGFATNYDGVGAIVVGTDEPGSPVPKGARLVACDGRTAAQYAEATLGKMWGNWALQAQRRARGGMLFLEESSGLIPVAKRCTFRVGGSTKTVSLDWSPLPLDHLTKVMKDLSQREKPRFSSRTLADGTRWLTMPSFDGNPSSEAVRTLPGMIAETAKDRASLASAPAIVLDLRGNGGGTSDWSQQLAKALWGEAAINLLPKSTSVHVDWRVSPNNLVTVARAYRNRRNSAGFPPEVDHWYRSVIAGLGVAIAQKQPLWRHVQFDPDKLGAIERKDPTNPAVAKLPKLSGSVYVLTDYVCMSACLDALDLWTALGATQIGQATGADTLYMENRTYYLPSEVAGGQMPMKVYRGRQRGSNEPAVPRHRFAGDMGDTKALEAWVATLPERRRRLR